MNSPQFLVISRFAAGVLLDRLRFLSSPQVMLETFETVEEPFFSADVWALAATDLVQRLEAGQAVEVGHTNAAILVEALEGSSLGSAGKTGRQEVAALLAKRLEPFIGRRVILDIPHAND
jgi:hypothetical protein